MSFIAYIAWLSIGDFEPTRAQSYFIDAVSLTPAAIGALVGIVVVLNRKRNQNSLGRFIALVGFLGCAALIAYFIWQSIQWHARFGYGTGH